MSFFEILTSIFIGIISFFFKKYSEFIQEAYKDINERLERIEETNVNEDKEKALTSQSLKFRLERISDEIEILSARSDLLEKDMKSIVEWCNQEGLNLRVSQVRRYNIEQK